MKKIKKVALILLIWLLTLFLISVVENSPIPIITNIGSFYQIPLIFWLVLLVSPVLLYIIAKDSENPFIPLGCSVLYFFLFYSYGLYFMSHPTISDIGSSGEFQSILSSISHIDPGEFDSERFFSSARYFQWPIFFIFSKIFTTVLGIGPIQTLNLGFFSLLLVLPIFIPLYYRRNKKEDYTKIYFIFPALYLTLCWHFINDQFVPQFLALVYLMVLFGFYVKYLNGRNPVFFLLMILFYALTVFSHAFMFMFFFIAIIFEMFWFEYVEMERSKIISYGLILIVFAMLFPYIGTFITMASGSSGGQSWRIFQGLFSSGGTSVSVIQGSPLYQLVPKVFDTYISLITTLSIAGVFSIVGIIFVIHFFQTIKKRNLLDFSVLIGSAAWFALGLSRLVLGQRAIQVAALPLSRYSKNTHKLFSYLSKIVLVILIIAPFFFTANSMINSSITGDRLIQDYQENLAGRFIDNHVTNESVVYSTQGPYPNGFPSGFYAFGELYKDLGEFLSALREGAPDFILYSPKMEKQFIYYSLSLPEDPHDSVLYDNMDIRIFTWK